MNKFNDLIFKNFFKLLTASIIVISFIYIFSENKISDKCLTVRCPRNTESL